MRTVKEIFKEQNPQDGSCPEWAINLCKAYAIEALKEAAEKAKPVVRLDIEWSKHDILINKSSITDIELK